MRLQTSGFGDAVSCPLTRKDYCRILRERVPYLRDEPEKE